ncbi:hypothetical protein [Flavobacterium sp.]|uniref:hypothetical protein n=1 Tax=Flavobacterium sp. TaxID=239 RepID=UPI0024872682|nr:hypothetical protein [Flavobacterium sp.]MDI1315767.1 hypothetical protein [Flavobacterium sp.]
MKKIVLACSALLLMLSSCSSSDSNSSSSNQKLRQEITTDNAGNSDTQTFTYTGDKLLRVNDSDGTYYKAIYTGNLITKLEGYDDTDALIDQSTFTYNSNNKLASYIYLDFEQDTAEREVFAYNSDGTISSSYYYGNSASATPTDLVTTRTITLLDGEVVSIVSTGDDNSSYTYTYDTKNNPYKNILGYDKIAGYADAGNRGVLRNIVTETRVTTGFTYTDNYSYTYDTSDFPLTSSISQSGMTMETVQYIYE